MVGRQGMSRSYRVAVAVVRPLSRALTVRDWQGAEHLPSEGGFVVCPNHVSHLDPFTAGHFLYEHGVLPRFLGKEVLFRLPVLGAVVRGAGQIPVYRESGDARQAYAAAVEAVRAGECVVIYPEGTLTRDPALWPMRGKTGAARVALETGCPVLPLAQWGPQHLLPPYAGVPRPLPRKRVTVRLGEPVNLSSFQGRPKDAALLRQASDAILDDLTALLAGIRGEQPPPVRWDPTLHRQPVTGNPKGRTT